MYSSASLVVRSRTMVFHSRDKRYSASKRTNRIGTGEEQDNGVFHPHDEQERTDSLIAYMRIQ